MQQQLCRLFQPCLTVRKEMAWMSPIGISIIIAKQVQKKKLQSYTLYSN